MEEEVKTEESKEEIQEQQQEEEKPLDKMTGPELREIAKDIPGVEGAHAMKKDELLKVIKEFRGIKDEEPAKKRKKVSKPALSSKELKRKVTQLRDEKVKAREAKDKKKVAILRRRINRMKKQTRKAAMA